MSDHKHPYFINWIIFAGERDRSTGLSRLKSTNFEDFVPVAAPGEDESNNFVTSVRNSDLSTEVIDTNFPRLNTTHHGHQASVDRQNIGPGINYNSLQRNKYLSPKSSNLKNQIVTITKSRQRTNQNKNNRQTVAEKSYLLLRKNGQNKARSTTTSISTTLTTTTTITTISTEITTTSVMTTTIRLVINRQIWK